MPNGPGDSRSTDTKSLLELRLDDLQTAVRHRHKDWTATLAAASDLQGNLADVLYAGNVRHEPRSNSNWRSGRRITRSTLRGPGQCAR